jgi:hypothetical protein
MLGKSWRSRKLAGSKAAENVKISRNFLVFLASDGASMESLESPSEFSPFSIVFLKLRDES